ATTVHSARLQDSMMRSLRRSITGPAEAVPGRKARRSWESQVESESQSDPPGRAARKNRPTPLGCVMTSLCHEKPGNLPGSSTVGDPGHWCTPNILERRKRSLCEPGRGENAR